VHSFSKGGHIELIQERERSFAGATGESDFYILCRGKAQESLIIAEGYPDELYFPAPGFRNVPPPNSPMGYQRSIAPIKKSYLIFFPSLDSHVSFLG